MPDEEKPAIAPTRERLTASHEQLLAETKEYIAHSRLMIIEAESLLDPSRSQPAS
ncbi:hypothetical protein [Mesorhizobium sp.]|uniref:hypothetical protein n=1 Tax=Mesorhizobium sp. TaxID=1871066 RepID=UPI0025FC4C80|nr:hypothetical protein [Mesorhizobium sp.]